MTRESESKAYDEGVVAYGDDVDRQDNPYDGREEMVREARQWFEGWDETKREDPLGGMEEEAEEDDEYD